MRAPGTDRRHSECLCIPPNKRFPLHFAPELCAPGLEVAVAVGIGLGKSWSSLLSIFHQLTLSVFCSSPVPKESQFCLHPAIV